MKDFIEQKIIKGLFSITVPKSSLVKFKEIVKKHNEEIKWKFSQREHINAEGEKRTALELEGDLKLTEMPDLRELFLGLVNEVIGKADLSEEEIQKYAVIFNGLSLGKDIDSSEKDKKIEKNSLYYYVQYYGGMTTFYVKMNDLFKLEEKYTPLINRTFRISPSEWYGQQIEYMGKTFVSKSLFESSKAIIELFEKYSNIKKIPYKKNKFRTHIFSEN